MEFQIVPQEAKQIQSNIGDVKKYIADIAATFTDVYYDDTQIKAAKEARANLNRLKADIDNRRKEVKKIVAAPYTAFEEELKAALIPLDKAINGIDTQVKGYEERQLAARIEFLKKHFVKLNPLGELLDFERVAQGEKWLNLSFGEGKAVAEMSDKLNKISRDIASLETIIKPEFRVVCLMAYINTFDVALAIAKQSDLEQQKAAQEQVLGAVELVAEKAEPQSAVETPQPMPAQEQVLGAVVESRRFVVTATPAQIGQLRQFCAANNIKLREVF